MLIKSTALYGVCVRMHKSKPLILTFSLLFLSGASILAKDSQTWLELRTPNFIVITNSSEKHARRVAEQFETIRAVSFEFANEKPSAAEVPITVIAAKDEATFRDLVPEFWVKKGSMHPAGVYRSAKKTNYIALRADILKPEASLDDSSQDAYRLVYEEYYAHTFVQRQSRTKRLPLWVVIGLTQLFGNTRVGNKEVLVGMPDGPTLMALQGAQLLPISALFEIDYSSPYYKEQRKAELFYAESWALMHYLMTRDWTENTRHTGDFTKLLEEGVPQTEAAIRTIGDLDTLQHALNNHIQARAFTAIKLKTPRIDQSTFHMRVMPDAEFLDIRSDFAANSGTSPSP